MEKLNIDAFSQLVVTREPYASALLKGNDQFPGLGGTVRFYQADKGTLVVAEVFNLPSVSPRDAGRLYGPFYGFHIHEGSSCGSGTGESPFMEAGSHYNPTGAQHPYHAGDMPSLLGNGGYAYMSFYTGRFTPENVVGKTVVVHQHADDFRSQPSGDAGEMIACGPIYRTKEPR